MRGLEEEYNPILAMFWCAFAVFFFFILITLPPILAASAYTAVTIAIYRVCYATISRTNPDFSDFTSTAVSFLSAALWPAYFAFGVFLFLGRAIRRE